VLSAEQRAEQAYAEQNPVAYDESVLLAAARQKTGLRDFGAEDFLPRLRVQLRSIEEDADLNALGRLGVWSNLLRYLCNRLRLEDLLRRHPEFREIPLPRPIIVVGMPRSGTTHLLNLLETGDSILDIVGPLGKPSEIRNFGTVVVMGGGVGTAMAYPTTAALKNAGNHVISIVGARSKDLVILEDEMRAVSDVLMITTDDGTYADKGFVTDKLRQLIQNGTRIDLVLAVGPIPMMRAVAEMTRGEKIPTVVSLNPIMIDGTGMCGGCRVLVEGKSEFACVDGPEFDAHRVDFPVLVQRNAMYRDAELRSMQDFQQDPAEQLKHLRESVERPCAVAGGAR
jgi:ferredoxin--NADP+ reductase